MEEFMYYSHKQLHQAGNDSYKIRDFVTDTMHHYGGYREYPRDKKLNFVYPQDLVLNSNLIVPEEDPIHLNLDEVSINKVRRK